MRKKIVREKREKRFIFLIFSIIIALAFFVRVYKVETVLGFYYDQGRDALVIWDLIHSGKLFLIGPTTGLAGIFRGPYYYYLITPFYLLGGGDPVWPAIFLALTSVLAVALIYDLGSKIENYWAGIIASLIASFSFYIVAASRWLSNPTPMLLFSMILTWAMLKIIQTKPSSAQKDKIGLAWVTISAVSGLSLFNFGSSGELFYFPAIIIFAVWQRKKLPNLKYLIISLLVFTLTFVPLVLFDLKHGHILVHNFLTTFTVGKEGSFKLPNLEFIAKRNSTYLDIFINKIFPTIGRREFWMLIVIFLSSIPLFPALIKNKGIKLIMLLLISPIIGLYFYQGNYGILYDYYMTGYYLIFVLFFSIILAKIWKTQANQHPLVKISRKLLVIYFFYLFVINNIPLIWARYSDGCAGKESICLLNQKQAIEWISSDAKNMGNKDFNVDVYVPPVIPYAYDYLFKWKSNPHNVSNQVPLLYTLYEVDPPHPERLKAWLDRQEQIGKIEYTYKTGGITVERRTRITK